MRTRWWRSTALSRYFARGASGVLLLVSLLGFTNVVGWAWLPIVFHFVLALLFGYVGVFLKDREHISPFVEALGVLLVVVKGLTVAGLWSAGEQILWGPIEVSCFVVGITAFLSGRYLRDDTRPG